MSASYDGDRKWSFRCVLGMHTWQLRNGLGQARYNACARCNLVNDAVSGPIGF